MLGDVVELVVSVKVVEVVLGDVAKLVERVGGFGCAGWGG